MKVFASPSSVILMGSILASSSMLVACGGGSGDGGGDQPATTESTSTPLTPLTPATPVTPEKPTTPLTPLTPATPVTPEKPTTPLTPLTPATPITPSVDNNSLVETATLPTMPVNQQPLSAVGDAAAISALSKGIYTTSSTLKLLSIGGGEVDCPASGDVNCAGIVRYQLDQNNKLTFSAWAYMPNSKKWIQFSERNGAFDQLFDFAELYSDGESWSQSGLDLSKISARTTATALSYHLGGTELSVVGNTTAATTAKANSNMSGVGYSNNAKAFSYRVGITKGEYMTLKKAGLWKKADDGNSYKNLAAFRAAHQQKNQALCLTADSSSQGVVFNPNQIGAQFVQLHGICDLQIDEKVPLIHTQEGVKSIAGREVIYLGQNPNSIFQKSNSESQFLWALALTDEGIPAQGKAYQKGYMKNINKEFYNEAAVIEWLKAKHGYNANLALPQ